MVLSIAVSLVCSSLWFVCTAKTFEPSPKRLFRAEGTLVQHIDASGGVISGSQASPSSLSEEYTTEKCTVDDCEHLMDDIHYSSRHRNKGKLHLIKDLQGIKCTAGSNTCTVLKMPVNRDVPNTVDTLKTAPMPLEGMRDFLRLGFKYHTDKVTDHRYEYLYQEYLGPLSKDGVHPFTFMEIGYSLGRSARAFQEFLPSADIHEFEISCDHPFSHANKTEHRNINGIKLHCGDARKADVIQESLAKVDPPFVIIDDGGHGPQDMLIPFQREWSRLQPGGFYFMEDLAESYEASHGFVSVMIKPLMKGLIMQGDARPVAFPEIASTLDHIKCMQQICVFAKKKG